MNQSFAGMHCRLQMIDCRFRVLHSNQSREERLGSIQQREGEKSVEKQLGSCGRHVVNEDRFVSSRNDDSRGHPPCSNKEPDPSPLPRTHSLVYRVPLTPQCLHLSRRVLHRGRKRRSFHSSLLVCACAFERLSAGLWWVRALLRRPR